MGWLEGWGYRKPVTLQAFTGDQTDLNFKITVDFILGKMESDFGDIRFTDSDGSTELSYYREKYTPDTDALFWIKVPSTTGGEEKTVYLYYGNPGQTTTSDGDATFVVFDDFIGNDGDESDPTKWSVTHVDAFEIKDNCLHMTVRNHKCYSILTFGLYYGFKCKSKNYSNYTEPIRQLGFISSGNALWGAHAAKRSVDAWGRWYGQSGYLDVGAAIAWDYNIWHEIEIRRESAVLTRCWFDALEYELAVGTDDGTLCSIALRSYTTASPPVNHYVDYMFCFKLPDDGSPPAGVEWGDEESEESPVGTGCILWTKKDPEASSWTLKTALMTSWSLRLICPSSDYGFSEQVYQGSGTKICVYDTQELVSEKIYQGTSTTLKLTPQVVAQESSLSWYGNGKKVRMAGVG